MNIKINDFMETIKGELEEYAGEIAQGVKDSVKKVAKETVWEVKHGSPVRYGNYQKGWGQTTISETPGRIIISVHNRKHYRLTHLLEDGHAKVNGGRTRAFPHITPAARFAQRELQREVSIKIRG